MPIPGHRTALQRIEAEAYRRIMAGEAPATLETFRQQLFAWLRQSHPDCSPVTLTDIESHIRKTWDRRHDMIYGGAL